MLWQNSGVKIMFFIDSDDDAHWYVVEWDKKDEWEKWLDSDSDEVPNYAIPIHGHPSLVSFNEYEVGRHG
jgi:hypothetical protein